MKICCHNCGRMIAEGNLPAIVKIKCPKCKVVNDLNVQDKTKPFTERLELERKDNVVFGTPGPEFIRLPEGDGNKVIFPDGFWDGQPVEYNGKDRRRKL